MILRQKYASKVPIKYVFRLLFSVACMMSAGYAILVVFKSFFKRTIQSETLPLCKYCG